ncbi:MAG: DUF3127 domain-containing protein [bacterium]|nr:DUF3127 domain-containing protein [bacterium]
MEISGKIIKKLDAVTGNSTRGEWKKQEFIIETEDKYPKQVCISAWAEKVDELTKFNINDKVKLSLNAESREYNGRWYTDLRFWKIEMLGSNPASTNTIAPATAAPVVEDFSNFDNSQESDDLPF